MFFDQQLLFIPETTLNYGNQLWLFDKLTSYMLQLKK